MRPAFTSTKAAAAFGLLLLGLLLLPALAGKRFLPSREEVYLSTPQRYGSTQYIYQQIFQEKGDIDIAFIGSSRMTFGIDTPYVQKKLSERLGRKAVVITLGWSWSGFDTLYFITQDLLQHRKVHLVVFTEELLQENDPHRAAAYWFRLGDNGGSLDGLPLTLQAEYYFGSVLGMPRNLLSLVRSNVPELAPAQAPAPIFGNPTEQLGSTLAKFGFHESTNFFSFVPANGISASNACLYAHTTPSPFHFEHSAAPLQLHFARRFGGLLQEHHVPMVDLHIPFLKEARTPFLREREFWPDVIGTNLVLLGIPPATMFSGLSDSEVLNLFFNPNHLNRNGQQYFTRLITPRLLEIYDHDSQASP